MRDFELEDLSSLVWRKAQSPSYTADLNIAASSQETHVFHQMSKYPCSEIVVLDLLALLIFVLEALGPDLPIPQIPNQAPFLYVCIIQHIQTQMMSDFQEHTMVKLKCHPRPESWSTFRNQNKNQMMSDIAEQLRSTGMEIVISGSMTFQHWGHDNYPSYQLRFMIDA